MQIQGIQKVTLLDYPEKVACTLFTSGCNFRCPYCHNASLVTRIDNSQTIPTDEVLNFLKKRAGVLDGVVISGGEPTLQPDLLEFMQVIKDMGYLIKLDTNGTNPKLLNAAIQSKLVDYVAMDIKNSPKYYPETAGVDNVDMASIEKSVRILCEGNVPYEFRTTVVKGLHDKRRMMELSLSLSVFVNDDYKYYLQNFKDSGDCIQSGYSAFKDNEMEKLLETVQEYLPKAKIRGID